ncbi:protein-disulfide reductase DsbD [Vibrio salinus]|uniref:protein-disulfide reductase DsbD n=1 Tax=Vibrio salinus TaxID=2899784 RepID=UPI001E55A230|nr:protein-disulfide reductase DsbD [Vibrio salinus]MCE0493905.1 protein-disulfide reductase DsbD [Vibrio salinus]
MLRTLLLVVSLLLSQYSQAAFKSGQTDPFGQSSNDFVTVDQAFAFNAVQSGNQLNIDWQIKSGYYLYKKNITINAKNVISGPLTLPEGLPHRDEFFGKVEIYRDSLFLSLSLNGINPGASISIQYQGCADKGFCYPPETRTITLTPTQVKTTGLSSPVSEQNQIAAQLSDNYWTLFFMFALGIGLAFTPCVLPMYPILTSIVLGQRKLTRKQTFSLSFTYVQGMALTYTILGLIVASAGLQFQAYLQNPYVLSTLSLLFILLALSMFGLFSLQLPPSLQTRLNEWSNGQKGGTFGGVFVMGAISGLVCSPCTTAPLSGALIYVSQTGNLYIGALALYLLALGMGVPLIAVALFGQQILPRSGMWMDKVKQLFGFVLLSAPLFLLERILPATVSSLLWTLLATSAITWLLWASFRNDSGLKTKIAGVILSAGIAFITITGVLLPSWHESHSLAFIRVTTVSQLEQQLKQAKNDGKPVMIDFYADWCVACKEFEKYTFSSENVQQALSGYTLIQADVTANNQNDQALLKHLHILGLPTLLFWDKQGNTSPSTRITGFMNADDFMIHLDRINNIQP